MIDASTLWDLIEKRAEATPDACFAMDEQKQELSFSEYRESSLRCAAGLHAIGVGAETRVSWQLPTSVESLILCAALSRLGAIQNPILPIYRDREIEFILDQLETRLLVVPGVFRGFDHGAMGTKLAATRSKLEVLITDDSLPSGDPKVLPPLNPPDDEPVRWVLYSSGTTADPKGARHTDGTLLAASYGFTERLQLQSDDRIALVFPVTHVGGVLWLMNGLRVGCLQIVVPTFDPATSIPLLADCGVTQATAGTVFHQAYLAAQRTHGASPLFPNVRTFPGGGAPKPPQLHHEIRQEMGAPIVSGYGLTECPVLAMNGPTEPDEKLANTEGRACPPEVEIRIVTLEGQPAGPEEEGEIRVKAPQQCLGYWDSSLDATAFDTEGFFRTGDLGYLDEQGYIVVTGRLKDVIIRKGENISAREVEDLLYRNPQVSDVAVIGIPDAERGERCCAVVVPTPGTAPLEFEEMVQFLKAEGLMLQKIPEQLESLPELPRNPTGKILKQDLRKRYADPD